MQRPLVIVATDLSPATEQAMAPAERLAAGLGADVLLVHAVRGVPKSAIGLSALPLRAPQVDAEVALAKQRLEELGRRLACSIPLATEVTVGDELDAAIADFARQRGAAYLVITSHGRTGVRRLVMGSIAEGVLRRARLPVVVVPLT